MMMCYCIQIHAYIVHFMFCFTPAVGELGITKFRAKILDTNTASLQLFNKLGFVEVIP